MKARKVFFEKEGYLVVEDLLSAAEVERCQTEIHRLHQFAAGQESDAEKEQAEVARRHVQREPFAHDETQADNLPVLRKAENTRQYSDVFRDLAQHPKLISVVQELIGIDLLLFRSTLMFKPAFHGSSHGLHQDSAYWPMEPPNLVTVSIALNDATVENGCFKVIPRSHLWGMQSWGHIARQQGAELTDRTEVAEQQMDVPLSAGSGLFFHRFNGTRVQDPTPRLTRGTRRCMLTFHRRSGMCRKVENQARKPFPLLRGSVAKQN